jgi:hypothetical protein
MKCGFDMEKGSRNYLFSCAEATKWKEQRFGLVGNLFAIHVRNVVIDLIDGDLVSTCNHRENWYGGECDA